MSVTRFITNHFCMGTARMNENNEPEEWACKRKG